MPRKSRSAGKPSKPGKVVWEDDPERNPVYSRRTSPYSKSTVSKVPRRGASVDKRYNMPKKYTKY